MAAEIFRKVEGELQSFLSGQSDIGDGSPDFSSIPASRDVLMLPWINAALHGDSLAMPASAEVQAASSSRSKKDSKTPTKRLRKHPETSTLRTPSDAAEEFHPICPSLN